MKSGMTLIMSATLLVALAAGPISAHCDRFDGPVAQDAISALEDDNFALIAVWVGEDQQQELQQAFDKASNVYGESDAATDLAERWFVETAVRLHRDAEGMPFTGVKPAGLPTPDDIATADRAYSSGEVDAVIALLQEEIDDHVRGLFHHAMETKTDDVNDIEAGREEVDAYVRYIVYVHSLYEAIQSGPEHGVGD